MARDLDAIADIEARSFSDPWSRDAFQALLLREDADVWVFDAEGRVTGYAVLWTSADEAELANLAVEPGSRRGGVGLSLVERALETARARGAATVYLEVRESNEAAARLYERLGFRQITMRRNYYRRPTEDARVMALPLRDLSGGDVPRS